MAIYSVVVTWVSVYLCLHVSASMSAPISLWSVLCSYWWPSIYTCHWMSCRYISSSCRCLWPFGFMNLMMAFQSLLDIKSNFCVKLFECSQAMVAKTLRTALIYNYIHSRALNWQSLLYSFYVVAPTPSVNYLSF